MSVYRDKTTLWRIEFGLGSSSTKFFRNSKIFFENFRHFFVYFLTEIFLKGNQNIRFIIRLLFSFYGTLNLAFLITKFTRYASSFLEASTGIKRQFLLLKMLCNRSRVISFSALKVRGSPSLKLSTALPNISGEA
ncbi:MAG: hypothetical protein Q8Q15_03950 [bacterium]|nr:hypothetical protein [bacterium]